MFSDKQVAEAYEEAKQVCASIDNEIAIKAKMAADKRDFIYRSFVAQTLSDLRKELLLETKKYLAPRKNPQNELTLEYSLKYKLSTSTPQQVADNILAELKKEGLSLNASEQGMLSDFTPGEEELGKAVLFFKLRDFINKLNDIESLNDFHSKVIVLGEQLKRINPRSLLSKTLSNCDAIAASYKQTFRLFHADNCKKHEINSAAFINQVCQLIERYRRSTANWDIESVCFHLGRYFGYLDKIPILQEKIDSTQLELNKQPTFKQAMTEAWSWYGNEQELCSYYHNDPGRAKSPDEKEIASRLEKRKKKLEDNLSDFKVKLADFKLKAEGYAFHSPFLNYRDVFLSKNSEWSLVGLLTLIRLYHPGVFQEIIRHLPAIFDKPVLPVNLKVDAKADVKEGAGQAASPVGIFAAPAAGDVKAAPAQDALKTSIECLKQALDNEMKVEAIANNRQVSSMLGDIKNQVDRFYAQYQDKVLTLPAIHRLEAALFNIALKLPKQMEGVEGDFARRVKQVVEKNCSELKEQLKLVAPGQRRR